VARLTVGAQRDQSGPAGDRRLRGDGAGGRPSGTGSTTRWANGTLTFAANQTSATIAVPDGERHAWSRARDCRVTLSNPTGGAALGAPAATTLTITDNDTAGTVAVQRGRLLGGRERGGRGLQTCSSRAAGPALASGIVVHYTVTGGTATNG